MVLTMAPVEPPSKASRLLVNETPLTLPWGEPLAKAARMTTVSPTPLPLDVVTLKVLLLSRIPTDWPLETPPPMCTIAGVDFAHWWRSFQRPVRGNSAQQQHL